MEVFLRTLPFLKILPENDFQALFSGSKIRTYSKKSSVFSQGDSADRFFLVMSGYIKLYQTTRDGNEVVLGLYGRGEGFGGEAVLFEGAAYPHNATAIEDSNILELSNTTVRGLITRNAEFSLYLMQSMTRQIERLRLEKEHLAVMSAKQRVACFLYQIYLSQCNGSKCEGKRLNLPSKKHLTAVHLGMKQETFSRALKELQTIGVNICQNTVVIKDSDALEKVCCSNCSASPQNCPLVKNMFSPNKESKEISPRASHQNT